MLASIAYDMCMPTLIFDTSQAGLLLLHISIRHYLLSSLTFTRRVRNSSLKISGAPEARPYHSLPAVTPAFQLFRFISFFQESKYKGYTFYQKA
jgi:hypothetical protein